MDELQQAIRVLRRNRAPGTDGVTQDLLKMLDYSAEKQLLSLLNQCLRERKIPEDWKQARIVSIFKNKGSPSLPENYRPISLLNSFYKVYASILQKRIALRHDHNIRSTQYGFRAHRSTTDPIFLLRRAQDYSAKTGHPIHMLFLDWKMAFDKVDHSAMHIALQRFGVHPHYLEIIQDIYTNPVFCVTSPHGDIVWDTANTGIRQGCPLSPYLFIILMSVLFTDVDSKLRTMGTPTNTWSVGKPIYDVEYADDTLLLAVTPPQLAELLQAVQVEATLYNLTLNFDKTEVLQHPNTPPIVIHFADGTPVTTVDKVKYLGTTVSWTHTTKQAIEARMQKAHSAYMKLQHLWRSRICLKAKIRLYHSYVLPVLLYSLQELTLEDKHLRTIDGWYFRYLCRCMGIKASYYSRIPNQRVWIHAGRPTLPTQTLLSNQQSRLIKSTLATPQDPLHHVIFSPGYKDRIKFSKSKNRGHPRQYWFDLVSKQAIKLAENFDHSARTQDFLGVKHLIHKHESFRSHLLAAPTRNAESFKFLRRSVRGAWRA